MMQAYLAQQVMAYLSRLTDQQLLDLVTRLVFPRLTVNQKKLLVEALQNEVIGITK